MVRSVKGGFDKVMIERVWVKALERRQDKNDDDMFEAQGPSRDPLKRSRDQNISRTIKYVSIFFVTN